MRSASKMTCSNAVLEMVSRKYFSTIKLAIGAAYLLPPPPFSTKTAKAIFGLSFGAKQINISGLRHADSALFLFFHTFPNCLIASDTLFLLAEKPLPFRQLLGQNIPD